MDDKITKDDMVQLQKSVADLTKNVDRILLYLYDDKNTNQPGIIQRLRTVEEKLELIDREMEDDRKAKKKVSAIWGVIGGAAATGLVMGLIKLIEHLFTK